jgi:phosphatidylglycerophosphate synthase
MKWRAVVVLGRWPAPVRRLAGLTVAARATAEAIGAGATEIWLVSDQAEVQREIEAELDRVLAGTPLRLITPNNLERELAANVDQPTIRLHCGRYIILADRLRRFASGSSARLVCGEGLAADRDGSGVEALDERDVLDLDRPRAAARKILAATAKSSDGIVSRWLNRPISQRVSAALLRIRGLRPCHLTLATAAMAALMFASFLEGGRGGLVLGGILFHVASVVDGIDGEVARATYRTSQRGAVLDSAVDMGTNLLFYLGITLSLARLYGPSHLIVGGWCLLVAIVGLLLIRTLANKVGDPGSFDVVKVHYRARYPHGIPAGIVAFLVAVTSRDFFAFGNALIILSGWGMAVSWLLAAFATLWLALIVIAAPGILSLGTASSHSPARSPRESLLATEFNR